MIPHFRETTITAFALATSLILFSSCKSNHSKTSNEGTPAEIVASMHLNNLNKATNPSKFLLDQADSPIHWQPWEKTVFANAAKEQKTVFVFAGKIADGYSVELLKKLNASASTCDKLNKSHINVLVDADQHPDLAFLIGSLNINVGKPKFDSQIAWFSSEGCPISWQSLNHNSVQDPVSIISRISRTVEVLWKEDPEYTLRNSRDDLERRLLTFSPKATQENNPSSTFRATRQIASLYDPTSGNIDHLSRISVARYTKLIALATAHPDLSDRQRQRYTDIATRTSDDILLPRLPEPKRNKGASSTRKHTEILPISVESLYSRTQTIEALCLLYQLTSDKKYLSGAQQLTQYIEKFLTLSDGGYSIGHLTENSASGRKEQNKLSTADTTATIASAYITAYRVSDDAQYLAKAEVILNFIRSKFIDETGKLQRCRYDGKLLKIPANGIDYARVCDAALNMYEATLDPLWLKWADQIHTEMNQTLNNTDQTDLLETINSNYPHQYQTRNFITLTSLNNESTWAFAYSNAKRLSMRLNNHQNTKQATYLKSCLANSVHANPIEYIDFLAADARLRQKMIFFKAPVTPELLKTALPHPCQLILVNDDTSAHSALGTATAELKSGQAIVVLRDEILGTAKSPDELALLLR